MTYQRRAEDSSILGKLAYYKEKFSFLWMFIIAFLAALGFGFKTPAQTALEFKNRQDQTDSALRIEISARKQLDQKIDILLKLNCLSIKIPAHDLQLIGLNCSAILGQ